MVFNLARNIYLTTGSASRNTGVLAIFVNQPVGGVNC